MLLTIINLPCNVKYSDIKALVQSKCNVADLILDNLTPHEKNTKKITIGLSCAEDAAMVMRNINGFYMDGRQLQVILKTKTSDSNVHNRAAGVLPTLRPSGPVAQPPRPIIHPPTNWYNSSFPQQPEVGNQLSAPVIPPLMNFGSQTAYYQMNQPTYPTPSTSATEKVGYPELQSYGSKRNQSDNQNNWSSNNWNQQEFSGFPNTEQNKNPKTTWDNNRESNYCESQWDNNPDARWNSNSDSNQADNRNSEWDGNRKSRWGSDKESKWSTNQQSKGNVSREFKRDRSPVSEWYSRRDNNSGETNRDSYRSSHRRDDQYNAGSARYQDSSYTRKDENNARDRRESSYTRNDQINARPRHDSSYKGRDQNNSRSTRNVSSSTRNDRNSVRSSGYDSSSMRNDRNYTRSSRHDADQNNARSSHRYSPYIKNDQDNATPGRHDGPYMRNDQNDTRSSRNIYGDHVNDLVKRDRNDRPRQNETNHGPRPLFDQHQLPPAKRSRFSNLDTIQTQPQNVVFEKKITPIRSDSKTVNKNKVPPKGPHGQHVGEIQDNTSSWRTQITRTVTKRTMRHTCCLYEGVKIEALQQKIKLAVRSRLDTRLQKKKYISAKQMAQIYYSKFDHASHCALLKENVEALGGKMIFQKNGPGGNPNLTQRQGPPQNTPARRGGNPNLTQRQGPPQNTSARRGGKVNVGQRQIPPLMAPGRAKNQSIPLAQIPGRIPQYPQGDKKIYKQLKRESANMFNDDAFLVNLMSSMPPAIQNAIGEEMEIIHKVIEDACDDPDPAGATFAEKAKYILPQKLKTVIKVNLTKRMLPSVPLQLSVFATPKVHRTLLENYLTAYNICCLKKSKNKPVYIVDCNSAEDHDKLCLMGPVRIGESTVTFKPFHLAGGMTKVKRNDIDKQREEFKTMQVRYFDKIFANTPQENCKDEESVVDVPVNQEVAVDIVKKEKQLGQDIKQLHNQIIDPVDVKIDNVTDVNTEIPTTTQDVQINDGDFTTDVDIDNFGKEVINDSYLPVDQVQATSWTEEVDGNIGNEDLGISEKSKEIKTEDDNDINSGQIKSEDGQDNKTVEEDLDIDDVNEDDLEDW